jgi:hypothetical protein
VLAAAIPLNSNTGKATKKQLLTTRFIDPPTVQSYLARIYGVGWVVKQFLASAG